MKIVIVEDEASIRNGLGKLLPRLNAAYEVAGISTDGKSGLEMLKKIRPQLVILDICMPEMDGLTMLRLAREEGLDCKAIVLTAYSEFSYAQEAIRLGIDNYLLKPIRVPELQAAVERIYETYLAEQKGQRLMERMTSVEQFFRSCILGESPKDGELADAVCKSCGILPDDEVAILSVALGKHYEKEYGRVDEILKLYLGKMGDYAYARILSSRLSMVIVLLYRMKDPDRIRERVSSTLRPVFQKNMKRMPVFAWSLSEGLNGLPAAFSAGLKIQKWNLCYPEGKLLVAGNTEKKETIPLRYPMALENHLRKAAIEKNLDTYTRLLGDFSAECRSGRYQPDEIRETCIRFCFGILTQAGAMDRVKPEVSTQEILGKISQAVTWEDILHEMNNLYSILGVCEKADEDLNILIRRAKKMIKEYYSYGITLGRIAKKLGVSEEYLSSLFKKETGMTFKETVRSYQIAKVKELLISSDLRLNQISDMTGYTDSKYMSRVFREETGLSPAEFRIRNR